MFRAELAEKLSGIFGFKKTTYDAPAPGASEQDTLFIEINEAQSRVTDGKAFSKVTGSIVCFSQMDKLPFGFFNKKIQQAPYSLTRSFYFLDIDLNPANSPARVQNITERRVKFVYLYSGQYDPEHGEITSLEL